MEAYLEKNLPLQAAQPCNSTVALRLRQPAPHRARGQAVGAAERPAWRVSGLRSP